MSRCGYGYLREDLDSAGYRDVRVAGLNLRLKRCCAGQPALLIRGPTADTCLAQFDSIETGLGFGWHEFPREAFRITRPIDGPDDPREGGLA